MEDESRFLKIPSNFQFLEKLQTDLISRCCRIPTIETFPLAPYRTETHTYSQLISKS